MNNTYLLRRARTQEKGKIMHLYRSMIGTAFCTWDESYPAQENIDEDLAAESLFVLADHDNLIGSVSVVAQHELDNLGVWQERETCAEISRVVIAKEYQGRGLASIMIGKLVSQYLIDHVNAVHLLVNMHHIPAQKTYAKLGFVIRGTYEAYGHMFYACQKKLDS